MRWIIPALAGVLVLAARPGIADQDVWREQSRKTVELRGLSTLEIQNARGRVELIPSPDGKLHLTALKIVRVAGRERAKELARGIVVETGARGDRYRVEVHYQKRREIRIEFWDLFRVGGVTLPRYEVRLTAEVPAGLAVQVRETSGDVVSDGIAGPQVLRSTSGDIEVRSPGGRVEASSTSGDVSAAALRAAVLRSTSGDVVVRQVAGPLRVSTSSGGITVTGAEDSLSLSTASGDLQVDPAPRGLNAETASGSIQARGVAGVVQVSTASGDVSLDVAEPLRGVEASTSSGEIRLLLAPAMACALDLRTASGSLEVGLPMEMKTASRRTVAGTIRGGRTPVVLRTVSGDITVSGGGE